MGLWDVLTDPPRGDGTFESWEGDSFRSQTWTDLVGLAHRKGAALSDAGVGPGERVVCLLTNSCDVAAGLLGVWLAGGTAASLPLPARHMSMEEYGRFAGGVVSSLDADVLIAEQRFSEMFAEGPGGARVLSWEGLDASRAFEPQPPGDHQPAFIQYSSGSTTEPKGCVLTTEAIFNQLRMLQRMLAGNSEDQGAVWLPLSHDMGLFGCLLFPWSLGFPLRLSSPERFLASPRSWFEDCAATGATITVGPNAALELAVQSHGAVPLRGSLRLKTCIVGAERIQWEALERAAARFSGTGFEMRTLMPAYGLAEATLAVTGVGLDQEPQFAEVDLDGVAHGQLRDPVSEDRAARVVCVGRPLPGVELEIDPAPLGEILLRSPSAATGYWDNPTATRERFVDEWIRTGDLGFLRDGELYVVGRIDDMLSLGGRNVFASEIEAALGTHSALRAGCCAIVERLSADGAALVLVAELKDQDGRLDELATELADEAGHFDVSLAECVFLPRGDMPKTPSGKIQRYRCREIASDPPAGAVARIALD